MSKISKIAFVFSALVGFTLSQPLVVSFAASPNAINNQTAQLISPVQNELGRSAVQGRAAQGEVGVYDRYDSYRGPNGFPLPGQAQLFEPLD